RGGSLVLSNVLLRHDVSTRLDHLIHVEDANLVLSRCQITAPAASGDFAGDLIAFRSVTTRPMPGDPVRPLFSEAVDQAVCRITDWCLITGGAALQAALALWLVVPSR